MLDTPVSAAHGRECPSALRAHQPRVLPNWARAWPARSWSWEQLRAEHGHEQVTCYGMRDGELEFSPSTGLVPSRRRLAEVLDAFENDGAEARWRVRARLPAELRGLARDLTIPAALRDRWRFELNLWMSPPGARSRLHFDQPHNVLVQILGTKDARLIAPSERRRVYPYPPWSANAQFSRVDLARVDVHRFPRFPHVRTHSATLEPGDALVIPSRTWHYLTAEEATLSIGLRWWPRRLAPLLIAADVLKRARGHIR